MGHQQISKAAAAADNDTERTARAAYRAAYEDALRQYQEDGGHAAFSARCEAAASDYKAAVEPVRARRNAVLDHVDD